MIFESLLAPVALSGYLLAASPASWCAPSRQPHVNVRTEKWTPGIDLTKRSSELQHYRVDTVNPYGPGVKSTVGGLTNASIEVKQQISVGGARLGAQRCLWYDKVEVTVVLKPTIFVARDYARGTCRFAAIWEHELKHVEVDKNLLDKYRPIYDRAVRDALREQLLVGPYTKTPDEAVQQKMVNRLNAVTTNITNRMKRERNKEQQKIDTLEEYERVGKLCR